MVAVTQSQARWFSAASVGDGDSFEKNCFIGAGKMAER